MRILGIDPGSRLTGYGVVDLIQGAGQRRVIRHVTHGTLRLSNTGGKSVIPLEHRLLLIHEGLCEIIQQHKPTVMAIERVFFAKNAVSALKLGQARGATILCGAIHGLEIVEYSPSEVKSALTGHGHADKDQVAKMVQLLLGNIPLDFVTSDASDGLALAVCHAHQLADIRKSASNHAELHKSAKVARGKKGRGGLAEALGITVEAVAELPKHLSGGSISKLRK